MKVPWHLLTDGSVNTQTKVGYGACLWLPEFTDSTALLKDTVKVKRFEATSSTKLELETLIWSLHDHLASANKQTIELTVYTDSQNIIDLPRRRERLERDDYFSSNKKQLKNHQLYRVFYSLMDRLHFNLVKVQGHQPSNERDLIAQHFSLVDQAARQALRADKV
jgi:ribonuclease HI|tara:strand:- start:1188 stop:1682 length:495 start_codon:yes stop_codon:yes gene_type:complete